VWAKGYGLSADKLAMQESFVHDGVPYTLKHGDVVLAAITGCTNATSPSVMLAAGNYYTESLGCVRSKIYIYKVVHVYVCMSV